MRRLAMLVAAALCVAASPAQAAEPGEAAPAYAATAAASGEPVALDGLRGEAVLLNSWATWCVPCREEMPELDRLARDFGPRGLEVVGVSVDERRDGADVQRFAREQLGASFPIWHDPDNEFQRTFRTTGVPQTILVDRDGTVVYHWRGALADEPATRRLIESALASTGDYGAVAREAASANSVGLIVALLAGILSFLSPCVFPLVPSFVAFLVGATGARPGPGGTVALAGQTATRSTLATGVLFVSGFSAVFLVLGASASALGVVADGATWLTRIGGVLLVAFGLHLVGLLRVPGLERDYRRQLTHRPAGNAGALVVGAAFGAGWTPCIGPALAGILTLAATTGTFAEGMLLLAAYSLGLALPFLAVTVALDRVRPALDSLRRVMPWVNRVSGVLLIAVGILLLTDSLQWLNDVASRVLPEGLG